jgi:hypothetical protein
MLVLQEQGLPPQVLGLLLGLLLGLQVAPGSQRLLPQAQVLLVQMSLEGVQVLGLPALVLMMLLVMLPVILLVMLLRVLALPTVRVLPLLRQILPGLPVAESAKLSVLRSIEARYRADPAWHERQRCRNYVRGRAVLKAGLQILEPVSIDWESAEAGAEGVAEWQSAPANDRQTGFQNRALEEQQASASPVLPPDRLRVLPDHQVG